MSDLKKIIISGASRGLGRNLALYFAGKGHKVVSFSRGDLKDSLRSLNIQHISGLDINDTHALEHKLTEHLAEADILINNAGVAYDGILATQDVDSIQNVISTNLTAPLYLSKFYIRARLAKRKSGNIVNISSIIGVRGYSGLAAYSASKAGLDGMTRALAREMGPKGFRVNSVLPGYFESELSKDLNESQRAQIVRRTPLGRLATYEDLCPIVDFFVSDQSSFITGQSLVVDGGITV